VHAARRAVEGDWIDTIVQRIYRWWYLFCRYYPPVSSACSSSSSWRWVNWYDSPADLSVMMFCFVLYILSSCKQCMQLVEQLKGIEFAGCSVDCSRMHESRWMFSRLLWFCRCITVDWCWSKWMSDWNPCYGVRKIWVIRPMGIRLPSSACKQDELAFEWRDGTFFLLDNGGPLG
jgi:hypothetical protein